MASKKPGTAGATEAAAETKLREAMAKLKAVSERHAAIVAAVSRLGVTPAERRLAQSESKKVDQELRDAKRLLREAQAGAKKTGMTSGR